MGDWRNVSFAWGGSPIAASWAAKAAGADAEGTAESTAKIDTAIREEFNSLPPYAQARMLDLLAGADPGNMAFWNEILGLDMPDAPPASA